MFVKKIGVENPHEDGSVACKRCTFIKKIENVGLDSGVFSSNLNRDVPGPLQLHMARLVPTGGKVKRKRKSNRGLIGVS